MSKILFENQTSNGTSDSVTLTGQDDVYIHLSGDLGGGTITIEGSIDGRDFVPIDMPSFTEPVIKLMQRTATSIAVRAVLAGAGSPDVTLIITE